MPTTENDIIATVNQYSDPQKRLQAYKYAKAIQILEQSGMEYGRDFGDSAAYKLMLNMSEEDLDRDFAQTAYNVFGKKAAPNTLKILGRNFVELGQSVIKSYKSAAYNMVGNDVMAAEVLRKGNEKIQEFYSHNPEWQAYNHWRQDEEFNFMRDAMGVIPSLVYAAGSYAVGSMLGAPWLGMVTSFSMGYGEIYEEAFNATQDYAYQNVLDGLRKNLFRENATLLERTAPKRFKDKETWYKTMLGNKNLRESLTKWKLDNPKEVAKIRRLALDTASGTGLLYGSIVMLTEGAQVKNIPGMNKFLKTPSIGRKFARRMAAKLGSKWWQRMIAGISTEGLQNIGEEVIQNMAQNTLIGLLAENKTFIESSLTKEDLKEYKHTALATIPMGILGAGGAFSNQILDVHDISDMAAERAYLDNLYASKQINKTQYKNRKIALEQAMAQKAQQNWKNTLKEEGLEGYDIDKVTTTLLNMVANKQKSKKQIHSYLKHIIGGVGTKESHSVYDKIRQLQREYKDIDTATLKREYAEIIPKIFPHIDKSISGQVVESIFAKADEVSQKAIHKMMENELIKYKTGQILKQDIGFFRDVQENLQKEVDKGIQKALDKVERKKKTFDIRGIIKDTDGKKIYNLKAGETQEWNGKDFKEFDAILEKEGNYNKPVYDKATGAESGRIIGLGYRTTGWFNNKPVVLFKNKDGKIGYADANSRIFSPLGSDAAIKEQTLLRHKGKQFIKNKIYGILGTPGNRKKSINDSTDSQINEAIFEFVNKRKEAAKKQQFGTQQVYDNPQNLASIVQEFDKIKNEIYAELTNNQQVNINERASKFLKEKVPVIIEDKNGETYKGQIDIQYNKSGTKYSYVVKRDGKVVKRTKFIDPKNDNTTLKELGVVDLAIDSTKNQKSKEKKTKGDKQQSPTNLRISIVRELRKINQGRGDLNKLKQLVKQGESSKDKLIKAAVNLAKRKINSLDSKKQSKDQLYHIELGSITAGVVVENGKVKEAADVFNKFIGQPISTLQDWIKNKGGKIYTTERKNEKSANAGESNTLEPPIKNKMSSIPLPPEKQAEEAFKKVVTWKNKDELRRMNIAKLRAKFQEIMQYNELPFTDEQVDKLQEVYDVYQEHKATLSDKKFGALKQLETKEKILKKSLDWEALNDKELDEISNNRLRKYAKMLDVQLEKIDLPEDLYDKIYDEVVRVRDYLKENDIHYQHTSDMELMANNEKLAGYILNRLSKHYKFIDAQSVTDTTIMKDIKGNPILGMAFKNIVLWANEKAKMDTPPHEFAHVYIKLLRKDPLIKRAIKEMGSEENLANYMGKYYVAESRKSIPKRIQSFVKKVWLRIKQVFNKLNDKEVLWMVSQNFFDGKINKQFAEGTDLGAEISYQHDNETKDSIDLPEYFDSKLTSNDSVIKRYLGAVDALDMKYLSGKANQVTYRKWVDMLVDKFNVSIDPETNFLTDIQNRVFRSMYVRLQENNQVTVNRKDTDKNQRRYLYYIRGAKKTEIGFLDEYRRERTNAIGDERILHPISNKALDFSETIMPIETLLKNIYQNLGQEPPRAVFLRDAEYGRRFKRWVYDDKRNFKDIINDEQLQDFAISNYLSYFGSRSDTKKLIFIELDNEHKNLMNRYVKQQIIDAIIKTDNLEKVAQQFNLDHQVLEEIIATRYKKNELNDEMEYVRAVWRYVNDNYTNKIMKQAFPQAFAEHMESDGEKFFKRWKLGFTPSLNSITPKPFKVIQYDAKKTKIVYKGKETYKNMQVNAQKELINYLENEEIQGLSNKYKKEIINDIKNGKISFLNNINDGTTWVDSEHLREALHGFGGNPNQRYLKSLYYHSDGKKDLIVGKHLEMVGQSGMKFIDSDTGELIAEFKKVDDKILLYDKDGKRMNAIQSKDELKMSKGEYAFEHGKAVTYPAGTRKAIQVPLKHSQNYSTILTQAFNYFDDSDTELIEAFNKFFTGILSVQELEKFEKIINNPDKFTKQILRDYNAVENMIDYHDMHLAHGGGLHNTNAGIVKMLLYRKLHKIARTQIEGTRSHFRPDISHRVGINEMQVGTDNSYVVEKVFKRYEQSLTTSSQRETWRKYTTKEKIAKVNDWLKDNPVYAFVGRSPVPQKIGAGSYRVTKLVPNIGNTMLLNPFDVYTKMQGDHDGDEANITFLDEGYLKEGQRFLELLWERQKSIDYLDRYLKPVNLNIADKKLSGSEGTSLKTLYDKLQISKKYLDGSDAIPEIASLQSIIGLMNYTDTELTFRINGKTVSIKAKKWTDPINANKLLEGKEDILYNSKGLYLDTVEDYLKFYLQAAVDNSKYALLEKLDYDIEHLMQIVFDIEGDENIIPYAFKAMRSFFRIPNKIKNGKNLGNSMGIKEYFDLSRDYAKFVKLDGNDRNQYFTKYLQDNVFTGKKAPILEDVKITRNNKVHMIEQIPITMNKLQEKAVGKFNMDMFYDESYPIGLDEEINFQFHSKVVNGGDAIVNKQRRKSSSHKLPPQDSGLFMLVPIDNNGNPKNGGNKVDILWDDKLLNGKGHRKMTHLEKFAKQAYEQIDPQELLTDVIDYVVGMNTDFNNIMDSLARERKEYDEVLDNRAFNDKIQILAKKRGREFHRLSPAGKVMATYLLLNQSVILHPSGVYFVKNDSKYPSIPPATGLHNDFYTDEMAYELDGKKYSMLELFYKEFNKQAQNEINKKFPESPFYRNKNYINQILQQKKGVVNLPLNLDIEIGKTGITYQDLIREGYIEVKADKGIVIKSWINQNTKEDNFKC